MESVFRLSQERAFELPDENEGTDVRFPPSYVRFFIDRYTTPGDLVFDPFAGFGTSLFVAEEMARRPFGLEFLAERVEFIAGRLNDPAAIRLGDATKLVDYDLPMIDLCITSPPYTYKGDQTNPFAANLDAGAGYNAYLDAMTEIFKRVGSCMRPGGRAVINIENNYRNAPVTMLAWDVARSVDSVLPFEREFVMVREPLDSRDTGHEYCLVFRRPELP